MTENWLRLIYKKGISLNQKRFLVEKLGSPEAVLRSSASDIRVILREAPFTQRIREIVATDSPAVGLAVERDLFRLSEQKAGFIPFNHPDYPPQLNHIDLAPLGLFYIGDRKLLATPQIAIVGSRLGSRSGNQIARQFASDLSAVGITITSGLASGIDSSAHRGALDVKEKTIAVMATGIDQVYPYKNRRLHQEITLQGLVVTEYPPGIAPRKSHFPQRNRIISGLSLGTLVVEAGVQSGSLITARLASEQGREVFAIPGSIHASGSRGCHYLIRQGAALVETVDDILIELGLTRNVRQTTEVSPPIRSAIDPELNQLYELIDYSPCPIEQLISLSGLTADQVSSILIRLELQGLVSESIGGYQRLPQATNSDLTVKTER